jgi:hypothetical protein
MMHIAQTLVVINGGMDAGNQGSTMIMLSDSARHNELPKRGA